MTDMTDGHVKFIEHCVPPVDEPQRLEVNFEDLKKWSMFNGNLPEVLPAPSADRGSKSASIGIELGKCHVFTTLTAFAREHSESEASLNYSLFPNLVRCTTAIPKGQLVLVSFTDSVGKLVDKMSPTTAEARYNGAIYSIEAPARPNVADEADSHKAAKLGGYWWVGATPDQALANVTLKTVQQGDVSVVVLTNKRALKPQEKLFKFRANEPKSKVTIDQFKMQPPAKRAKP